MKIKVKKNISKIQELSLVRLLNIYKHNRIDYTIIEYISVNYGMCKLWNVRGKGRNVWNVRT